MKNKLVLLLSLSLLILSGCELREKENYISFNKNKEIEYDKKFNVCSLVKKVDKYSSKDFAIKDNIITLPNDRIITCNESNKKIKLDTIKFGFKYRGQVEYIKVKFVDTTKPTLQGIKDKYVVEKGNEYFDLNQIIKANDNHDKNLKLYFNGTYDINTIGLYDMEVVVTDKFKNKTIKKFIVEIKDSLNEKEKEEEKNYSSDTVYVPPTSNTGGGDNYIPPPPQTPLKEPKTFSLDYYNSFDECLNACNSYIQGSVGLCSPFKKNGLNYGYQASFN